MAGRPRAGSVRLVISSNVRPRSRRRRATALASLWLAVLLVPAGPALALERSDGDDPGAGLPTGHALLLYVGIPLLVFVTLSFLTFAPGVTRKPRSRAKHR